MKSTWTLKLPVSTRIFVLVALNTWLCYGRNDVKTWLQSPIVTNWGTWGSGELCPNHTFVEGIEVKVEGFVKRGDDTALNGVRLVCTDIRSGRRNKWVSDKVGDFGIWRGLRNCQNGLATGFKLRSEPYQRRGDDTAGVDMALICTNSTGSKTVIVGSGLHGWGRWTSEQNCPPNTAICGIKTQIERNQGRGDDTGLNNVKVACCSLPSICENCEFGKRWKRLLGCHHGLRDCKLKITTGIENTEATTNKLSQSTRFYSKVSRTLEAGIKGAIFSAKVAANFEWGQEKVNGRTMEEIVRSTSFRKKEISVTLDCVGWAEELIITRGSFELSTGEFRCVPFTNETCPCQCQ